MRGQVAGNAEVSPAIRPVAREIEIEHHVVLYAERIERTDAERRVCGENQQSGRLFGNAQFDRRAQHSLGVDPEDPALKDLPTVGHGGAEGGKGHDVTGTHVRGTAPHVTFGAVARVHPAPGDLCGVRVLLSADNPRRDDSRYGGSDHVD